MTWAVALQPPSSPAHDVVRTVVTDTKFQIHTRISKRFATFEPREAVAQSV